MWSQTARQKNSRKRQLDGEDVVMCNNEWLDTVSKDQQRWSAQLRDDFALQRGGTQIESGELRWLRHRRIYMRR